MKTVLGVMAWGALLAAAAAAWAQAGTGCGIPFIPTMQMRQLPGMLRSG